METHPMDELWQKGQNLVKCLGHMLQNEIGCDVTFKIVSPNGTSTSIVAHKLILRARSPVFEAMFSGAYVESTGDVEICDIQNDSFNEMLRYIYDDAVLLTGANVLNILYAAKKYLLHGLELKCKRFLKEEISTRNVCNILSQSMIYGEDELTRNCLSLIGHKTGEVLRTEGFYDLSKQALLKILQYDWLSLGVESELYKASVEWAKRKAETQEDDVIRTELEDCLHQVRFVSMTPEEFAKTVGNSDILTHEEKSSFLCLLHTGNGKHVERLRHIGFNLTSRVAQFERYSYRKPKRYIVSCCGKPEVVSFSTDQAVEFVGCNVYCGEPGSQHEVEISLKDKTTDAEVCEATSVKVTSDGSEQGSLLCLEKGIRLEKHTEYIFTGMLRNGLSTGYGRDSCGYVKEQGITLRCKALYWPYKAAGDNTTFRGQFPTFFLKKTF